MDSIAMHRVRLLHAPEDNGTSTDAKKDGHRAPQPPVAPKGSQLERLAARFNALHASQDDSTGQDTKSGNAMLWAQAFPAARNPPTPAPRDEGQSRADEDEQCDDNAETLTPDPEKALPEERQPSPRETPPGADTTAVRAFAMTHAAPPVASASSGGSPGDAPSAVIDGIVSRLADFCADPAVFERGAWHVTVPLQTVLPDCVLHVALSHFDLTLRFETSSDSARNVLLQHASTLRDRLTALLKAKQTTPRGIEIIVI